MLTDFLRPCEIFSRLYEIGAWTAVGADAAAPARHTAQSSGVRGRSGLRWRWRVVKLGKFDQQAEEQQRQKQDQQSV